MGKKGVVGLLGALSAMAALGSPELDSQYAFHSPLAVVVGIDGGNLHGQKVQAAINSFFERRTRFEKINDAAPPLAGLFAKTPVADMGAVKAEELQPWLTAARAAGADSAVFVQLQQLDEQIQLAFIGAVTQPAEIVFRRVVKVADRFSINSFLSATEEGLSGFVQAMPFDATVISREGYRVVLDRGAPSFRQGTRVAVFTLERDAAGLALEETGVIGINRADANLAFGTILVENKPREISKGNKVRFQTVGPMVVGGGQQQTRVATNLGNTPSRSIASVAEATTADSVFNKVKWGSIDIEVAGSVIGWTRTDFSGAVSQESGFYPGAAIQAQFKLTEETFAEVGGLFGTGAVGGMASTTNQMRLQFGYRLSLTQRGMGPTVTVRAGYSRTQFQVADQPTILSPTSAAFGGIAWGGGFLFPLTEKFGVGLELTALAFPSISEGGGTSGATSFDVSGWDFAVRGYYHLTDKVNLQGKLVFQTHTANFSGVGTRPIVLSSLSQNTSAFLGGISYFF